MRITDFASHPDYDIVYSHVKTINKELNEGQWRGRFQIVWQKCEGFTTTMVDNFLIEIYILDKRMNWCDTVFINSHTASLEGMRALVIRFMQDMIARFPMVGYDVIDYRKM